jgi:hypothetical protein
MDVHVVTDDLTVPGTGDDWNSESEQLLYKWVTDYTDLSAFHSRRQAMFNALRVTILSSTMILAYVFGSSGLATGGNAEQNYVLLVIGGLSTVLKQAKLEKRSAKHKRLKTEYAHFARKIEIQLAMQRSHRTEFVPFVETINREYRKLAKSNITSLLGKQTLDHGA